MKIRKVNRWLEIL
ncbi:MAG: hypothetical protein GWN00_02535, partial [Aliifodinibius sp.]|nr:hypothetical protein [Fodinibius sp.]NIY23732.1 hypothetical protein [Fodinibius sp.]